MTLRSTARITALALMLSLAGPALAQPDPLARGRYLGETIMACGNCHTPKGPEGERPGMALAGGAEFGEAAFRALAPNITPDPETGIGRWSDAEIGRAIREGIRPDGRVIGPPMPMAFYRAISDADLVALVAWLRSVAPVRNAVGASEYRIPLPASYGPPLTTVPSPAETPVERGAYLAAIGHCLECHTPMQRGQRDASRLGAGGQAFRGPWGVSIARNITPHREEGIGAWSDAEIIRAVTQGIAASGRPLSPPMGYAYYARMTPADLGDLVAYLRSLPPQP